jgi:hypothetical protein
MKEKGTRRVPCPLIFKIASNRGWESRCEQRALEKSIARIHFMVAVQVKPPTAAPIFRIAGTEFRLKDSVYEGRYELLEWTNRG